MIRAIMKGIISAIKTEYGSKYEVYKNPPEQGLNKGSFLVRCIAPVTVPKFRNRAEKSYTFHIKYFPKDANNPDLECFEVGETLSSVLQIITVDGVAVHSKGELSCKVVDGVLQFTVTYFVYAMMVEEAGENMEIMSQSVLIVG